MENSKHTPGPWHANWTRISGQAIGFHITDSKHGSLRPICEAYDNTGTISADEIEANARLIAAAPELLEALNNSANHIAAMMAHIEHKPERFKQHCWKQALDARAAIAKATRK